MYRNCSQRISQRLSRISAVDTLPRYSVAVQNDDDYTVHNITESEVPSVIDEEAAPSYFEFTDMEIVEGTQNDETPSSISAATFSPTIIRSEVPGPQDKWDIRKCDVIVSGKTCGILSLHYRRRHPTAANRPSHTDFVGGDTIRGNVELDVANPQSFDSISLTLKGQVVSGYYRDENHTFLTRTVLLWSRADGDPAAARTPTSPFASHSPLRPAFHGRFHGYYRFQFDFEFPTHVEVPGKGNSPTQWYPTPQSFLEKSAAVSVHYELQLIFAHGRLRSPSKTRVPVTYMPKTKPDSPSILRQLAYQQGNRLTGPENDPGGWQEVGSTTIRGIHDVSGRRAEVGVRCTLFLAKPLCYSRGTVIPCYLYFSTADGEVIDTLSQPKVINLRLLRKLHYYKNGRQAQSRDASRMTDEAHEIQNAVWWEPPADLHSSRGRFLEGELHLASKMQPSCDFYAFCLNYSVELMPIQRSRNFEPFISGDDPLIKVPVSISSFHNEESPKPTSFAARRPMKPIKHSYEIPSELRRVLVDVLMPLRCAYSTMPSST